MREQLINIVLILLIFRFINIEAVLIITSMIKLSMGWSDNFNWTAKFHW